MGFYSTTLEQEKPHQKTSDCAQKNASGKFFVSNRNRTYQIERNPLETQQEKLTTTRETASGVFFYKYRHYSPELGRWPSRDPIEEKGGINLYAFVGNEPIGRWDYLGNLGSGASYGTGKYGYGTSFSDGLQWDLMRAGAASLYPIANEIMWHADYSKGGAGAAVTWDFSGLANYRKYANNTVWTDANHKGTGKDFRQWMKDEVYNRFHKSAVGKHVFNIAKTDFKFDKPSDGYFAFGDARLTHKGSATVTRGWFTVCIKVEQEVELNDLYTFSGYRALGITKLTTPTAVGYRLQDSGYLRPVTVTGKWDWSKSYTFWK